MMTQEELARWRSLKKARYQAFLNKKRDWIGAERREGRWFKALYWMRRHFVCPVTGHKLYPLTLCDSYVAFELFGPGRWVCRRCMWQGVPPEEAEYFRGYATMDPETMEWMPPNQTDSAAGIRTPV
jgi:hypothetical protein